METRTRAVQRMRSGILVETYARRPAQLETTECAPWSVWLMEPVNARKATSVRMVSASRRLNVLQVQTLPILSPLLVLVFLLSMVECLLCCLLPGVLSWSHVSINKRFRNYLAADPGECKANETYTECGSSCEPSCSNPIPVCDI